MDEGVDEGRRLVFDGARGIHHTNGAVEWGSTRIMC